MTDWNDNLPIYVQLRQLVLSRILSGALPEGDPIPSVRQVASDERINPITVSRAYQMLVDEGLLEKRRGLGMYVTAGAAELALEQERHHFLHNEWPQILRRIHELKFDAKQLLAGEPS